jgi:PIN domain nuclease of toxin-antitoxin system
MQMLNLDTHVLVYALLDDLTQKEQRLLTTHTWSISAIVLWELAKLQQLKRIVVDLDAAAITQRLSALRVWPLDLAVARQSTRLDFLSDPADEIIAATSIVHRVPLLTRDRRMRTSRMVPLA